MDSKTDEARLDTMIRQCDPVLDDNGFSDRVLRSLPARRPLRHLRALVLLASAALSVVVTVLVVGPQALVSSLVLGPSLFAPTSMIGMAILSMVVLGVADALSNEA